MIATAQLRRARNLTTATATPVASEEVEAMDGEFELARRGIVADLEKFSREFGAKLDEIMAAIPVREVSQLAKRLEGRRRAPAGSEATKLLR